MNDLIVLSFDHELGPIGGCTPSPLITSLNSTSDLDSLNRFAENARQKHPEETFARTSYITAATMKAGGSEPMDFLQGSQYNTNMNDMSSPAMSLMQPQQNLNGQPPSGGSSFSNPFGNMNGPGEGLLTQPLQLPPNNSSTSQPPPLESSLNHGTPVPNLPPNPNNPNFSLPQPPTNVGSSSTNKRKTPSNQFDGGDTSNESQPPSRRQRTSGGGFDNGNNNNSTVVGSSSSTAEVSPTIAEANTRPTRNQRKSPTTKAQPPPRSNNKRRGTNA